MAIKKITPITQQTVDSMKKIIFFIMPFFILLGYSHAAEKYPADITAYLNVADDCQYFAGEWDSTLPKERQIEIEKKVNVTCSKARSLQEKLSVKYKKRQDLLDVINDYDF
ncbi:membrane protein [Yersinia pseudotuberculosis]|uniref:hypothetical protein n=1 Tax=Yersinia pseudotuberculosis TaxID=633 RepID=UPI00061C2653|nr:hypothetical protein [Yersinia pseudotuberculosis]CNG31105.1 membrane protein [Yersinia pseudotuberculosis]